MNPNQSTSSDSAELTGAWGRAIAPPPQQGAEALLRASALARAKPFPSTTVPHETTAVLSSVEQDRLAQILDEYLVAIERGEPIEPKALLARYPEHAAQLREYLSGLELFHAAAAGVANIVEPPRSGSRATGVLPSGETIGDYQLLREIGRGGMGIVYEAEQVSLRRRVALKVLPFTASHDTKQIGRFKNEARAAAQVQHPNIVPVHAVGEENGVHYYVMQLISGRSLTSLLEELRAGKESTTLNTADHVRTVARLGIQAAEALHAAHEYGVVHRDVKPSNLLLDEHGKLWITDFGLARCRENISLTQTGDVLGTMRYMSPEQAQGRAALIDHRTDVYSLGVTLYELATLVHPAGALSDLQLYFERDRSNVKSLRHWNRNIPLDFQTIVLKALSEFPYERYSTAEELADDLKRFLEGRPILASPPSVTTRVGKWAKRRRRVLYAVAIVGWIGLFGLVGHTWSLSQEQAVTGRALERARGNLHRAFAVLDRLSLLGDQLAATPGAEGVRHQLLQDSLSFYQEFEAQADGDAWLSADLALAQNKLGGLAEKMGDQAQALEAYTTACKVWEERLAQQPESTEFHRNLALCQNNLGMLLSQMGRGSEALTLLREASDAQSRLGEQDPASPQYAADLAITHNNLGLVLGQAKQTGDAAQEFQRAIGLQEKLAAATPNDENVLRALAASYNNLGSASEANAERKAEVYRQAIAIQRRLIEANPNNRLYQGDLARTYNNLGYLASGRKDWQQAELFYRDAIHLQENLVRASPLAGAYRRDLAISYNNLGMVQSHGAHLAEAEASFRQAIQLQRQLLSQQPADVQMLSNQGSVKNNLAMLLERQQRPAEAETHFRQAIRHQKQALAAVPASGRYRALLSKHYANYGANLRNQDKLAAALEAALDRKKLWNGQAEPLRAAAQDLAALYGQMKASASTDAATKKQCAAAAVATLRQALKAGLPTRHVNDASLAALADTSAYQHLLAEIRAETARPVATQQADSRRAL